MKKYIYLVLTAILFNSCSDFLDREPNDTLFPGIFWETENDAKLTLTACYRDFEGEGILYNDCASDNAYNFHRHEGYQALGDGSIVAGETNAVSFFSYTTIRKCNEFLENIDKVHFKDDANLTAQQKKNAMIAEVRFIRAYRYFIMTQFYGDVPLVTKTFKTPDEAKVSRDSREKVEQFIITELQDISKNKYLLEHQDQSNKGRITLSAAHALLSRIHLYRKEYAEAIAEANLVKGHSLFPSYEGLFLLANNNNSEAILEYQYVKDEYQLDFTPYLPNSAGGWSSVVPLQSLVDNYETIDGLTIAEAKANGTYDESNPFVNRDPRLRATIIYPGQLWDGQIYSSVVVGDLDHFQSANNATSSGYNFKKYFSNLEQYGGNYWNTGKYLMIIRYAEVLLNLAEAKIEKGDIDDEMYASLNAVRKRAGLPEVNKSKYNNQAKLRELVRRERRSEFAFEGLRRFDIIRWNIAKDVMNGNAYGCRQIKPNAEWLKGQLPNGDYNVNLTEAPIIVEKRTFHDRNMLLPIPQDAIDKNKNLLPNNPGY